MTDLELAAARHWARQGEVGDDGAMNGIDDDLAQRVADALMAHGLAAAALDGTANAPPAARAGQLARLDEALADRLAALAIDAETMAAAMARVALRLASISASASMPASASTARARVSNQR